MKSRNVKIFHCNNKVDYEYNMSEEISKRQPHKCKVVTKFKIASKKGEIRRSNDETDATTESTHLKKA